jgi:hypothetical protein
MAKKNLLGLAKLPKKKIRRKGRHSKAHKAKKFFRGQGSQYEKILWLPKEIPL